MLPTFAISSLFLNSPLISVTFPLLSNSVHRKRSSFDAFAARLRPILNKFPVPSSRNGPLFVVAFLSAFPAVPFRLKSNNLRSNGRLFVDECLDDSRHVKNGFAIGLRQTEGRDWGVFRHLDRRLGTLKNPACKVARHDAVLICVQLDKDEVCDNCRFLEEWGCVDGLDVKKSTESDCERRNRSNDTEGADGLSGARESISVHIRLSGKVRLSSRWKQLSDAVLSSF